MKRKNTYVSKQKKNKCFLNNVYTRTHTTHTLCGVELVCFIRDTDIIITSKLFSTLAGWCLGLVVLFVEFTWDKSVFSYSRQVTSLPCSQLFWVINIPSGYFIYLSLPNWSKYEVRKMLTVIVKAVYEVVVN